MVAANIVCTNSKIGCENELAYSLKQNLTLYLPNLSEYVDFEKGEEKNDNNIKIWRTIKRFK